MAVNDSCSVPGDDCTPPGGPIASGLCSKHYARKRRGKPLTAKTNRLSLGEARPTGCSVRNADCSPPNGLIINGYCQRHYGRWYKWDDPLAGGPFPKHAKGMAPKVCSVANSDCSPPGGRIVTGLCCVHYKRKANYGHALAVPKKAPDGAGLQFVLDALHYDGDDCLIWPYGRAKGYGTLKYQGQGIGAHRLVLVLLTGGPPSPELEAAHAPGICHNRACLNPRHLRWDSVSGNQMDKVLDDTHNRGRRHPHVKLTEEQVRAIRADTRPLRVISDAYGTSYSNVSTIRNRRTWAWLD